MSLIYIIGALFFIISLWQFFLHGPQYKLIGVISVLFVIGGLLVIIGQRHLGQLLIYLFESWFLLMQLLVQSKIHKYYSHIFLFIFLYSVLVSLFFWFMDVNYFWAYLLLTAIFLYFNLKEHPIFKGADQMFSNIHFEVVHGDVNKEKSKKNVSKDTKAKKILKNSLYQAVGTFVLSTLIAFFIFNGGF